MCPFEGLCLHIQHLVVNLKVIRIKLCFTYRKSHKHVLTVKKSCSPQAPDRVKSMQSSGTVAIGSKIQPSRPKQDITYITDSHKTKRSYKVGFRDFSAGRKSTYIGSEEST